MPSAPEWAGPVRMLLLAAPSQKQKPIVLWCSPIVLQYSTIGGAFAEAKASLKRPRGRFAQAALFRDDTQSLPLIVQTMQITTLVVISAGLLSFLVYYLFPWLALTLTESRRVAEMLSLLPSEANIEVLVADALGQGR